MSRQLPCKVVMVLPSCGTPPVSGAHTSRSGYTGMSAPALSAQERDVLFLPSNRPFQPENALARFVTACLWNVGHPIFPLSSLRTKGHLFPAQNGVRSTFQISLRVAIPLLRTGKPVVCPFICTSLRELLLDLPAPGETPNLWGKCSGCERTHWWGHTAA